MRCGNCKSDHPTAADVRVCYENAGKIKVEERSTNMTCAGMGDPHPLWPASDKQKSYVLGLQDERLLPDGYNVKTMLDLDMMERDEVSAEINLLKTFPRDATKATSSTRKQWDMPEGRYAVWHEGKGAWWFFEVGKPTEGRWVGYTFIKHLIGSPGAYKKVDMSPAERIGWLTAIEKDPKQAMIDYGLNSGVCGKCSSPLTDPESLARGLGPVCATKSGWF